MTTQITRKEVAKHASEDDLWVVVDHKVYDLSDFIDVSIEESTTLTIEVLTIWTSGASWWRGRPPPSRWPGCNSSLLQPPPS